MKSEEVVRLDALIEEENSSFETLSRELSDLTDYEDALFSQWNDEASRNIRARFAAPREEDAKSLMVNKQLVCDDAGSILSEGDNLFAAASEMGKISAEIHRRIESADKYQKDADDFVQRTVALVGDFEDREQQTISLRNDLIEMNSDFNDLLRQRQPVF